MHSRDPWELNRLIHLIMQTGPAEPRAALLCHSLQQQLETVDTQAMACLHGSQLSATDKETLHLILQASLSELDLLSWWGRFTRLTLPAIDLRMKVEKNSADIQIVFERGHDFEEPLKSLLRDYVIAFTGSRMTQGLMELGLIDTSQPVQTTSKLTFMLPGNSDRKGSIPAVRARQQCFKALSMLPGSEQDLGVEIGNWMEQQPQAPVIDDCAAIFKTSARTINRKLAMLGIKYNALQEQHRSFRALSGLKQQELPIWQLAEQLGYDNQANFGRACRRWFGHSPRTLKEMLNPPPQQELLW